MPTWVTLAFILAAAVAAAATIYVIRIRRRLIRTEQQQDALMGMVESLQITTSQLAREMEQRHRVAEIIAEADELTGIPQQQQRRSARERADDRWRQFSVVAVTAGATWLADHKARLVVAAAAGAATLVTWPSPAPDYERALPDRPVPTDEPTMMAPPPEPPPMIRPPDEPTDDGDAPAAGESADERRAAAPEVDGPPLESPQPEPPGQPTPTTEPAPPSEPAPEPSPTPPEREPRTVPPEPPDEPPPDPNPPRPDDPPDPPDPDPPGPPDDPPGQARCALLVEADLDPALRARLELLCG